MLFVNDLNFIENARLRTKYKRNKFKNLTVVTFLNFEKGVGNFETKCFVYIEIILIIS